MSKGLSAGVLFGDSEVRLESMETLREYNDPRVEFITEGLEQEVGLEQNFFYEMCQYSANAILHCERGVGYLTAKGKPRQVHLLRHNPLSYWDGYQMTPLVPGKRVDFNVSFPHITISTYLPESYSKALQGQHAVLCSTSPQTPTPVELPEKTLLGRLDGRIQSIDSKELLEILGNDKVLGVLTESEGAIEMRTRVLNLVNNGMLSLSSIKLRGFTNSNRPEPSEGTIIYNKESKCLEFGVGDKWKTIKLED